MKTRAEAFDIEQLFFSGKKLIEKIFNFINLAEIIKQNGTTSNINLDGGELKKFLDNFLLR